MVIEGRIAPVVGQVVAFEEIPKALEDFANRRTIGRTVVMIT
jgi:NADPH:quinone reductase-like Zn-dependent oxidoreductase